MFAPLALIPMAFGAMLNRLSVAAAQLFFYAFAAVMGLSLSWIFAVFTGVSIATTFFVTAIAFASLSLYGYTTKRDLSGMGTFLMMGLIGLIVASIINIFLASGAMQFAISVIGVLIFAGLTAYDTQSIKAEYVAHASQGDQDWLGKAAIMGRAAPLPRLPEHVPVPADVPRQPGMITLKRSVARRPSLSGGNRKGPGHRTAARAGFSIGTTSGRTRTNEKGRPKMRGFAGRPDQR